LSAIPRIRWSRVKRAEGGRKPGSVAVGCIQLSGSLPCTLCGWTSFHRFPFTRGRVVSAVRLSRAYHRFWPVLRLRVRGRLCATGLSPCHTCREPGLSSFRPAPSVGALRSKADSHATLLQNTTERAQL
jgi:hypothetical protein